MKLYSFFSISLYSILRGIITSNLNSTVFNSIYSCEGYLASRKIGLLIVAVAVHLHYYYVSPFLKWQCGLLFASAGTVLYRTDSGKYCGYVPFVVIVKIIRIWGTNENNIPMKCSKRIM